MAFFTESGIAVRYAETDRMGVVYHSNYLIWMEVGRTDFLAALGFPYSKLENDGILFPTSEASLRIFHSTGYEERLVVRTRLARLQSRKVVFEYEVLRDGKTVVTGSTTHICVDSRMRVKTIPQPLFGELEAALNDRTA